MCQIAINCVMCKCLEVRDRLKTDGTRLRTVGEVKGEHASGVGRQQSCTLPWNVVYLLLLQLVCTTRLPVVD